MSTPDVGTMERESAAAAPELPALQEARRSKLTPAERSAEAP